MALNDVPQNAHVLKKELQKLAAAIRELMAWRLI